MATHRQVLHLLMAKALITAEKCFVPKTKEEEDETERVYNSYRDIISTLPRTKGWATQHLCQYQGFWFQPLVGLEGIMWMQQHFTSRPTDIYLVSSPKSGTTWLKALLFSIINRNLYDFSTHPLLTTSVHDVVPFMELDLFKNTPIADPDILPSPRIFATHIPFTSLPDSIKNSSCPIVYISRNPKDVLVSSWQFVNKVKPKDLPPLLLEEAFEMFSEGISPYGLFWDQVLGYWKASLELPEKILFLKYEDIKKEPLLNIKRVAGFVGRPFCLQEEENGTVQEILKLCNFDNMKNLEVNKNGLYRVRKTKNDVFFREGKVGDWKNYLTNEMAERTS